MSSTFDITPLKRTIEDVLKSHDIPANTEPDPNKRGDMYTVHTQKATIRITIGEAWIGYELDVDKDVVGKTIGSSLDTDLYPLGDGNEAISQEIFNDTLVCLKALLSGKIYAGLISGKPALAIPHANGLYKVSSGKFFIRSEEMNEVELKKITGLRVLT